MLSEEAATVASLGLDSPERVAAVVDLLKASSIPPHAGLAATGLVIRRHRDERLIRATEAWWELIHTRSHRDQLTVDFVLRQANIPYAAIQGSFWRNELGDRVAHWPAPWKELRCGVAYLDAEEYAAVEDLVSELGIRTVIETGAGETSILFTRLGLQTTSIEAKAGPWSTRARAHGCGVVEVPFDYRSATFSAPELRRAHEVDLVFIDSPIGTRNRASVLSQLLESVTARYVMYHDTRRDFGNIVRDHEAFGLQLVRFVKSPRGLSLFRIGGRSGPPRC